MNLYLIKRANYKLQPYNLIGEVYNANNELIGAILFFRKKDAEEYIRWLNEKIGYPIDCDIVKVEVKEEQIS